MVLASKLTEEKAKLYVVTCISNPVRYASRYRLYNEFEKLVTDAGAELYTVELAYGNRPFEITQPNKLHNIQLRTNHELWHKENLINAGINRLPSDWEYVAWIDADIKFARNDWVKETIHQLQHYDIIQMFSVAQDLTPNFEPMQKHFGFMYSYLNERPASLNYTNWHPGFAWAARRSAVDNLGGLIDYGILGAGDRHMACALIGKINESYPQSLIKTNYGKHLRIWEDRALKYVKKNVGCMDGLILHSWHGKKRDRRYVDRWKILINNNFDPELDIKRDSQGIYQLTERNIRLRDDIRWYFRSRNEDSIDLE